MTATHHIAPPQKQRAPRTNAILLVAIISLAIFGDVLGFNQLATQSPIDAVLQILVFVVGAAGALEAERGFLTETKLSRRLVALGFALLSIAAFATWFAGFSTGVMATLVTLSGLLIGGVGIHTLWGQDQKISSESRQLIGFVALAQGLICVWFGLLAFAAIEGPLFG